MDKVIGLGHTGCGIADEFLQYPEAASLLAD